MGLRHQSRASDLSGTKHYLTFGTLNWIRSSSNVALTPANNGKYYLYRTDNARLWILLTPLIKVSCYHANATRYLSHILKLEDCLKTLSIIFNNSAPEMCRIASGSITPSLSVKRQVLSMRRRTSATERNALISGDRAKIIRPIIFNSQRRRRVFQRAEGVSTGAVCMLNPAREVPRVQLL